MNSIFLTWILQGEVTLTVKVPTRSIACRGLELWRRWERASDRLALAGRRLHAVRSTPGAHNIVRRPERVWRKHHSLMMQAVDAWGRMDDFCQAHGMDPTIYGAEPHDVDPFHASLFEAVAEVLAGDKAGRGPSAMNAAEPAAA